MNLCPYQCVCNTFFFGFNEKTLKSICGVREACSQMFYKQNILPTACMCVFSTETERNKGSGVCVSAWAVLCFLVLARKPILCQYLETQ